MSGNPATTLNDMKGMSTSTSIPHLVRRATAAVALAGLVVVAAACGSDSKSASNTGATSATTTTTAAASGKVAVTKQWARTSPTNAANGAAYFTITSPADDTLTGVSVDASVAKMSQMHETVMGGGMTGTTMPGTTMAGATTTAPQMTMQPVDKIELKAGIATEFKPGGYHIMLMELTKPLKVGDSIALTLTLAKAGSITVQVPVLDQAP
jgi:copper(I)-binding protein